MVDFVVFYDYAVDSELGRLDSWKNGRMKSNFMGFVLAGAHFNFWQAPVLQPRF
jgi:hypothetical protein